MAWGLRGIRAYRTPAGPALFRLDDHLERLFDSAHILALDHGFERPALAAACRDVLVHNGLDSGYIRPLFFLGAENRHRPGGNQSPRHDRRLALARLSG